MCICAYKPSIGVGSETGFPELTSGPASPVDVISSSERSCPGKHGTDDDGGTHPVALWIAHSRGHTLHSAGLHAHSQLPMR